MLQAPHRLTAIGNRDELVPSAPAAAAGVAYGGQMAQHWRSLAVVVFAAALAAAGCNKNQDSDTDEEDEPETTAQAEADPEPTAEPSSAASAPSAPSTEGTNPEAVPTTTGRKAYYPQPTHTTTKPTTTTTTTGQGQPGFTGFRFHTKGTPGATSTKTAAPPPAATSTGAKTGRGIPAPPGGRPQPGTK